MSRYLANKAGDIHLNFFILYLNYVAMSFMKTKTKDEGI